jgi:hypothetical protein
MQTQFRLFVDNNDYLDIVVNINVEIYNNLKYYSLVFNYDISNFIEDEIKHFSTSNINDSIINLMKNKKQEFKRISLNYIKKGSNIHERSDRYSHIYNIITIVEDYSDMRFFELKNTITDNYELSTTLDYHNFLGNEYIFLEKLNNLIRKNSMTQKLIEYLMMDETDLSNFTGTITPKQYKIKILESLSLFAD